MAWETLATLSTATIRRRGRFLVAELKGPHAAISTSARNGGFSRQLRYLVNHQSCEGSGHEERFQLIHALGQEAYHDAVCEEIGLDPSAAAVMGTAANMNYAAVATERDGDVEITAAVTAGVQTNAVCAGDPAAWRETPNGVTKVPAVAGTINVIVLMNQPVVDHALARTSSR